MSSRLPGGTACAVGAVRETSTCWNDDSDWPTPTKPRFAFDLGNVSGCESPCILRQLSRTWIQKGSWDDGTWKGNVSNSSGFKNKLPWALSTYIVLILSASCSWQVQPYLPLISSIIPLPPLTLRSVPAAAQLLTTVFERLRRPGGGFFLLGVWVIVISGSLLHHYP